MCIKMRFIFFTLGLIVHSVSQTLEHRRQTDRDLIASSAPRSIAVPMSLEGGFLALTRTTRVRLSLTPAPRYARM